MVDFYKELSDLEASFTIGIEGISQKQADNILMDAKRNTQKFSSRASLFIGESTSVGQYLVDGKFDYVFIDANHKYESVKADIHLWCSKVRVGGILCGHDYASRQDMPGVLGVKRAVDEFCHRNDLTVNILPGRIWWIRI